MLQGVLDRLVQWDTRKVLGLSVFFKNDGSRHFQALVLQIAKKEDIQILEKQSFSELAHLSEWIEGNYKDLPIALGVDGRSILVRRIDQIDGEVSIQSIISSIVSTGNPDDFALNVYQLDQIFYAAISRREALQNLLEEFKNNGLTPSELYIGLPPYLKLIEELSADDSSFGNYQITSKDQSKIQFARTDEAPKESISTGLGLTHEYLGVFGYAYRFIQPKTQDFITANYQELKDLILDYPQKVLNKYLLRTELGLLLVALLVNAFLFMDYSAENTKLSEKSSDTQMLMDSYIKKEKEYDEKQKLINQLNYNNANLAYLADYVASCVKGNLLLTNLALNPVSSDKRKKDSPFDQGVLLIEGESKTSQEFGRFITAIQKLEFVDEINYQNYSFSQRKQLGTFEIKLSLKLD
ncbi:MAG: hypothetical protein NXI20_07195 [bacterium]|nr:hypothetical protein [bacterium]